MRPIEKAKNYQKKLEVNLDVIHESLKKLQISHKTPRDKELIQKALDALGRIT